MNFEGLVKSKSVKNELTSKCLFTGWQSHRKKKWICLIAIILTCTFIPQNIAYSQDAAPIWSKEQNGNGDVRIPKEIAVIKESYAASNGKTVINIQDAHASLGAQESIVAALDFLVANYDLKLVAIEGSSGYIDTSLLKTFPNERMRRSAAEYLMKQGKMSAGEFFSITSNKPIALYGIEDKPLYTENVEQFRKIYEINESAGKDIKKMLEVLRSLKGKIYSDDLKALDEDADLHINGKISFSARWKLTRDLAARYGIDYKKYDNLAKLIRSFDLEKGINFEKANKERSLLINELSKKLPKDRLEQVILKSASFSAHKIAQGEYYAYLQRLVRENGIDPSPYSNLIAYTDYAALYESVDILAVFEEIKDLEGRIQSKLFKNEDQKKLYEFSQYIGQLKDLFELKLTNVDFKCISENGKESNAREISKFVKDAAVKYNVKIDNKENDLAGTFRNIPIALEFYKTAEKRNSAMLANTIKRMSAEGQRMAALITGGYHTKGLTERLKENKTSYFVLLPTFDPSKGERPYAAILTNKKQSYESFLDTGKYYLATSALLEGADLTKFEEAFGHILEQTIDEIKTKVSDPGEIETRLLSSIHSWVENRESFLKANPPPGEFRPIRSEEFEKYLLRLSGKLLSKPEKWEEKDRDTKGENAGHAREIIEDLIKQGKVVEVFLAKDHLVAYRVRWIYDYKPGQIQERDNVFEEEIKVNQLFTTVQQNHMISWIRVHPINRGAIRLPHFRVILDDVSLRWTDHIETSNICHAGHRDGVIYIGERLLTSMFDYASDPVRNLVLDQDEYQHLLDPNFVCTVDKKVLKKRLRAVNERIKDILSKPPSIAKYKLKVCTTHDEAIAKHSGINPDNGNIRWGNFRPRMNPYITDRIGPITVSAGLYIIKSKGGPSLETADTNMKIWVEGKDEPGKWNEIKMDMIYAKDLGGGIAFSFVGTLPAFFKGKYTFRYSVDGGKNWQWANNGPGDDRVIIRQEALQQSGKKLIAKQADEYLIGPRGGKHRTIRLYKHDLNLRWIFDMPSDSSGRRIIFSDNNIGSVQGKGEGSVSMYYDPLEKAVLINMESMVSNGPSQDSVGVLREAGWDLARIKIPIDENGIAKEVIHEREFMGISRSGIAILLKHAGVDTKFKDIYALVKQELVLREVDKFAEEQEAQDTKTLSIDPMNKVDDFLRDPEAFGVFENLRGDIKKIEDIIIFAKPWELKQYALERLKGLVNKGYYGRDEYFELATYAAEKDGLEEMAYIERTIRQDKSFLTDMGIDAARVDSITLHWRARGLTKAIYHVTINMDDGTERIFAISLMRPLYSQLGFSMEEIEKSLDLWSKMSEAGVDYVPHFYAVRRINDYRPKLFDKELPVHTTPGPTIVSNTINPAKIMYNDLLIIAREFVQGYDMPGYCTHCCTTHQEERDVYVAGISAYFRMWKEGKKTVADTGRALLNPDPRNVVVHPEGNNYHGVVTDLNGLREGVGLEELLTSLQKTGYEKKDVLAAARQTLDGAEYEFAKQYYRTGEHPDFKAVCTEALTRESIQKLVAGILKNPARLNKEEQVISPKKVKFALDSIFHIVGRSTNDLSGEDRRLILSKIKRLIRQGFPNKIRYFRMRESQQPVAEMLCAFAKENTHYLVEGFLNDEGFSSAGNSLAREGHLRRVILRQMLRELYPKGDKADNIEKTLLGPDLLFREALSNYAWKCRIRTAMEDHVLCRNLVTYQKSRDKDVARRAAAEYVETIYMIMKKEMDEDGRVFGSSEELIDYLRTHFGVRKFIIAGGKGTRFSPGGLILKPRFKPDNYNTNIKLSRESSAFGTLEDVIVVDATTVFYILKDKCPIAASIKSGIRDRISSEISKLVDAGVIDSRKGADLSSAIRRIVDEEMHYTRRPDGLWDLSMVLRSIEEKAGEKDLKSHLVIDKIAYAIFKTIMDDKTLIDKSKIDELFGRNCIVVLDSGEGHGGAYAEALSELETSGKLQEARYSVIVYADSPGWGLDRYPNYVFTSYLATVNLLSPKVNDLPKVTIAVKNPKDGRAEGRARVFTEYTEKFANTPIGLKEWADMSPAERAESIDMARQHDQRWLTNANILIYDTMWAAKRRGVLYERYRHELGEAGEHKQRSYEYWASDYLNIAAAEYEETAKENPDASPMTRLVYVGESAPDALKTLPTALNYRDDRQDMIIKKIRAMGVVVDPDVTISISSDDMGAASFDLCRAIDSIFGDNREDAPGSGPIRLKGTIHLSDTVVVKKGATLDGTKKDISLTGKCVVERGVELGGVIAENELFTNSRPYEQENVYLTGFPFSSQSTVESVPVTGIDFRAMGIIVNDSTRVWIAKKDKDRSDLEILKNIFGNDTDGHRVTDQIFLYGDIVLDENVRVENGTMLDGRRNRVILTGKTHVGKGVNLKGVKAEDTVFAGIDYLDVYHYRQPAHDSIIEINNSLFVNSYIEFGAKVRNSMAINSCVMTEALIAESDILGEIVVPGNDITNRRLKDMVNTVSLSVEIGDRIEKDYVPGPFRLEELSPEDQVGIREGYQKVAAYFYERIIPVRSVRKRLIEDTQKFLYSDVTAKLTIEQLKQYIFAKARENIRRYGSKSNEAERPARLAAVIRAHLQPVMEEAHSVDMGNAPVARNTFRRLAILSARFNFVDYSINPEIFDTGHLDAAAKNPEKDFTLLDQFAEKELAIDGLNKFEEMVFGSRKGTFLYLTDNIGETEADAPMWEFLVRMGHTVVIGAKDEFCFGDIDVEGVEKIIADHPSLSEYEKSGGIRVIKTGSASEGVFAHSFSHEVQEVLKDKSLIALISKGQANIFSLSARNNMKMPVVAMLVSKSITAKRITGIAPKVVGDKTTFWPVIAVIPAGSHIMDCKGPSQFEGTLQRFGTVRDELVSGERSSFIVGLPKGTPKKIASMVETAVNASPLLGKTAKIEVFSEGAEEFDEMLAKERTNGVYLDESVLSQLAAQQDAQDLINSVSVTVSSILIDSRTREDLENILIEIEQNIEAIKKCDIDEDKAKLEELMNKHSSYIKDLKLLISRRKQIIEKAYNSNIDRIVREATSYDNKIAVATTETVAGFDPFTFDNIGKAAAQGIVNYFIFGDILKSPEEAEAFVKACGYEGDMAAIRFIDKRGLSYRELAARIAAETNLPMEKIGIRAAAGELELPKNGEEAVPGVLLEVQAKGDIYLAMNSYQALLKILTQLKEGATLEEIKISGVEKTGRRGVFNYSPRIDYDKDMKDYRNAIGLILVRTNA